MVNSVINDRKTRLLTLLIITARFFYYIPFKYKNQKNSDYEL